MPCACVILNNVQNRLKKKQICTLAQQDYAVFLQETAGDEKIFVLFMQKMKILSEKGDKI